MSRLHERLPALTGFQVEKATRYRLSFVGMVEEWADRLLAPDDPEYEQQEPEFVEALKEEAVRRLSEPEMLKAQYWMDREYRRTHARGFGRLEDNKFLREIEDAVDSALEERE